MENSNSREYLEKITASVIDNLRQTGPAPSVQLQDVPRKPFGGMTDEEEAELDDLDEDENKDVRMTEHRWAKNADHITESEPTELHVKMATSAALMIIARERWTSTPLMPLLPKPLMVLRMMGPLRNTPARMGTM